MTALQFLTSITKSDATNVNKIQKRRSSWWKVERRLPTETPLFGTILYQCGGRLIVANDKKMYFFLSRKTHTH